MTPAPTRPSASGLSLDLTIPGDERFVETVRALSARIAAHVGYAAADAAAIGGAVGQAVAGVVEYALERDPERSLEIRFATVADAIEISLRYHDGGGDGRSRVERRLARRDARDAEAPLDALRRVMPRVEFAREDDVEVCRLARPLPGRS